MEESTTRNRTVGQTEVIVGDDLQIVPILNHRFAEGAVCLIYDRNLTEIAERIIKDLKSGGYRVFVQAVSSRRSGGNERASGVPEYVRHVFAVGAGTAASAAKQKAKQLDVDWTMYLTAPTTDTILCDYAPKTVLIDRNVMLNCPFECVASGYGILFSQPLAAFESFFANKILACESGFDARQVKAGDVCELAVALLEISLRKRDDSAQIMSEILYSRAVKRGKRPRLIGEYKFLASAMIMSFYSSYLGAPSIDTMPPACREVAADELKRGEYESKERKSVDFFDANSYFKISYILSEYRTDLLDKLGSIDLHTSQRFWRRLYPDAGYWLKSEVNCKELESCLTLAGSQSENLLGFAYASGILSAF